MKKQLLHTALLLGLLSGNIYADTINTVPLASDRFTYNNINNTISTGTEHTFMISASGELLAIGNNLYGVDSSKKLNSDAWQPVIKDSLYTPMDKVVKVDSNNYQGTIILTEEGKAYLLGAYTVSSSTKTYNVPTLVNVASKIVDVHAVRADNTGWLNDHYYMLDEHGNVYHTTNQVPSEIKFRTIEAFPYNGGSPFCVALTEDGTMYSISNASAPVQLKDSTGAPINNVSKIYNPYDHDTMLLRNNNGKLLSYNLRNKAVSPIKYYVDGVEQGASIYVNDVIYSEASKAYYIKTNNGIFKGDITNTRADLINDLPFNPVTLATTKTDTLFIDDIGNAWVKGANKGNQVGQIASNPDSFTMYKETWMNSNPIVENAILAKFNIDSNSLLERETEYTLEFSLVTYQDPKAFNIYFAKAEDVDEQAKWHTIAKDISVSHLKPTEYDTGYIDSTGLAIKGKTYSYNWTIGSEDLTGIQVVVEPIY